MSKQIITNKEVEDDMIKEVLLAYHNERKVLDTGLEKTLRLVFRIGYAQCISDLKEKKNDLYTDIVSTGGMDPR